jgi:hypothetical protein
MLKLECDGCGREIFEGNNIYCECCQEPEGVPEFDYTGKNLNALVDEIIFQMDYLHNLPLVVYKRELRYIITKEIEKFLEGE